MKRRLLQFALYLGLPLGLAAALYAATQGDFGSHFQNSLADQTAMASIHPVILDSGFTLRQPVDTSALNIQRDGIRDAPVCFWIRIEYDRKHWTTRGTVLLTLVSGERSWQNQIRSEQITTYFQPICIPGSRTQDVVDRPTHVDITVVEPGLKQVAMLALGPGNGQNNATINGQPSDYTLNYRLTANPGPGRFDIVQFGLIFAFACALLFTVLGPLVRPPRG